MGRSSIKKLEVSADGTGLSSRAGAALLPLAAERLGLTDALAWALAETRERRSAHDRGRVFCDLAVMLADGGRCVSDLIALGAQPALFGDVASVSTARRVLLSVGAGELDRLRTARARARARAWAAGAAPEQVILDVDATPITAHSDKEHAAGHDMAAAQGQSAGRCSVSRRAWRVGRPATRAGSVFTRCWPRAGGSCWPRSCGPAM